MNRRNFLAALAALPVIGRFVPVPKPTSDDLLREAFAKCEFKPPVQPRVLMTFAERNALIPAGDLIAKCAFVDVAIWSEGVGIPDGLRPWTECDEHCLADGIERSRGEIGRREGEFWSPDPDAWTWP
jgi:hypothetical protein